MRKLSILATAALLISLSACGASPAGPPAAPTTTSTVPSTATPAPTATPSTGTTPAAPASTPAPTPATAPASASDTAPASQPAPAPTAVAITQTAAEDIALGHAQLARTDIDSLQSWGDRNRGRDSFEVKFHRTDTEYNYEIAVENGEILEWDVEYHHTRATAPNDGSVTITQDQATSIALTDAGVAQADAQRLHVEFDRDDGRSIYEIDWRSGNTKYDYEIDATSGDILGFDHDYNR